MLPSDEETSVVQQNSAPPNNNDEEEKKQSTQQQQQQQEEQQNNEKLKQSKLLKEESKLSSTTGEERNDEDLENLNQEKIKSLIEEINRVELVSLPDDDLVVDTNDDEIQSLDDEISLENKQQESETQEMKLDKEEPNELSKESNDSESLSSSTEQQYVIVAQEQEMIQEPEIRKSSTSNESSVIPPKPRERKSLLINKSNQTEPSYPTELNPFGDDENEEVNNKPNNPVIKIDDVIYPKDLNPFGDPDEDDNENQESNQHQTTSSSMNPFGSDTDSDEEQDSTRSAHRYSSSPQVMVKNPQNRSSQMINNRKKKRPAPLPPNKSSQSLTNLQANQLDDSGTSSTMYDSIISQTSSNIDLDVTANSSISTTSENVSPVPTPKPRRSKMETPNTVRAQLKAIKNKKRPAPPRPAFKRELKTTSIEEMDQELVEIAKKLPEIQVEQNELEKWLLEHKDQQQQQQQNNEEETTPEQDEYDEKLERFLDLAKTRCKLGRKQKELMYMKREIKLEEKQIELEYQLRVIMSKQDAQKTEQDHQEEQHLLQKMMEIVEERNDIIENMIQDENKEIEQYQNIVSNILPSNVLQEEPTNQQNNSTTMTKGGTKGLKLLKLKKFHKKLKNKVKGKSMKTAGGVADGSSSKNDLAVTCSDDNKSFTSTEERSLTPPPVNKQQIDQDESKSPQQNKMKNDFAKLGRTTLKKLSNPTKTLNKVSNDLRNKFHHHHSNHHNNNQEKQQ